MRRSSENPPQNDEPKKEPKPDQVCKFLVENIGSDPVQIATGALAGLIVGDRVGQAAGGLAERAMRSGPAIGSVVRSGRTAAIGARAGRIGGAVGAVAGAAAGIYFQRDIENFVNDICTPSGQ